MATSIDYRIVEAQFRNSSFEKNIAQSTESLERFKRSLDVDEQAKSLEKLDNAADLAGMKGLAQQVDKVADKFSAMGVVAFTALQRITNAAIDTGVSLVKSLSIDQITAGWNKYEQKTANVQTLVNATGKSVEDINGYLEKLMMFSDETSYDFTTMAQSLGQMVTSGGDIDKLIPMIEGIANATSFAGKGAQEFSRSIYNLNQSYGQGYLTLMDWRSVELSGVASQQLKETFIEVGKALGTLDKNGKTAKGTLVDIGNFSTTLADKWATRDVMEQAFGRFAQVTEAAYKLVEAGMADTYSEAYAMLDGHFEQVYYRAALAAQEAKTFGEAINSVKDAVSSGWMTTFDYIFGGYDKAKEIWTNLANDLWDVFAAPAQERNSVLRVWAAEAGKDLGNGLKGLGGQAALWEGITNIFKSLLSVIQAVKEGFSEIFPSKTAQEIADFTFRFRDLSEKLIASEDTLTKIQKVASGLASVLKLMLIPIKAVLGIIGTIITEAAPLTEYLLDFLAFIGTLTTNLAKVINESKIIEGVFATLKSSIEAVGGAFAFLGGMISSGISALMGVNILDIEGVTTALASIPPIGIEVGKVFDTIGDSAKKNLGGLSDGAERIKKVAISVKDTIVKVCSAISQVLSPVLSRIKQIFKNVTLTDAIGTTLLVGLYQQIKKIATALAKVKSNWAGVTKALTNVLNTAGDALKTFQNKVNAEVLKSIAVAVGILAASLFLISRVDTGKMLGSFAAVALLFGELAYILGSLGKKELVIGKAEIITLSGAMVGMALALNIMANGLAKIAEVENGGNIGKAALAIGSLMTALAVLSTAMSIYAGDKDILRLSVVMLAFGASIKILASAIDSLSTITWNEIWPGLVGLAGALGSIVAVVAILKSKWMTANMAHVPATLVALGVSLMALVVPLRMLGSMPYADVKTGADALLGMMTGMTLLLSVLKVGNLTSGTFTLSGDLSKAASSLMALGTALTMLVIPIQILGKLPTDQLAQGMDSVIALLTGFTIALSAMKLTSGGLVGVGGSLIAMAAALTALILPITILGKIKFTTLITGLAGLVVTMTALGGTVYIIGKFSKAFSGMTASITGFAAGALVMIGAIAAFTAAIAALATMGTAAAAGLAGFLQGLKIMAPVIEDGLVSLVQVISNVLKRSAPALAEATLVLIDETLKYLVIYTPTILENLGTWLVQLVEGLETYAPEIQNALKMVFQVIFGDVTREELVSGLVLTIGSLVGSLKLLAAAKSFAKDGLIGAAAIAGVVTIVGGALMLLQQWGDTSQILNTSASLSLIMLSMASVMKIGAAIGPVAAQALIGVGAIAAAIVVLTAIFGGLQLLVDNCPIAQTIMEGNIRMMEYFGKAIGAFVGGIKAGVEAVSGDDFLTKIGKQLSGFWDAAEKFFNGIGSIKQEAFSNIKSMAVALAALTGAKFLENLSKVPIVGKSSLVYFAEELEKATPSFVAFFDAVKSVDESAMKKGVEVVQIMGDAVEATPRMGGLAQGIMGHQFINLFAKELANAAPRIVEFSKACIGLSSDSKLYAKLMSDVIIAVSPCVDYLPRYAGIEQILFGHNLISIFAEELATAAPHIVSFGKEMANAPTNMIDIATDTATIIGKLADAADHVPKTSIRTGGTSFGNFAKQLKAMGEAILEYSIVVADINTDGMNAASEALRTLISSIQNAEVLTTIQKKLKDIESGIYLVVTNIANNIITQFSDRTDEYVDIGINYLKGIRKGLSDIPTVNSLKGVAANVAQSIDRTFRDELDIHSPSKKGELIGKYYDMGVRYGLDGSKKTVLVAARSLTNEMLKNGEITYQELQEVYQKFNTSIASAENKRLFVLNAQNRVGMAELEDTVGTSLDNIVEETKAMFYKTGTAIDEGSEKTKSKAKKAGEETGDSYIEGIQSKLNELGTRLTSYSLEQKMWTTLFGDTATDADKTAVDEALKVKELNNLTQQLGKAEEEYAATVKEYGSESKNALNAYNKLLNAQITLAEKAQEVKSNQEEVTTSEKDRMVAYANWMVEYKDMLLEQGFALEQINRVAAKDTGYDPYNLLTTTASEATKAADAALEAARQSYVNSADDVLGSLTPTFLQYGQTMSTTFGQGITEKADAVANSTGQVVNGGLAMAQSKEEQWVACGEIISERISEGIIANGGDIQGALNTVLGDIISMVSGGAVDGYTDNLSIGIQTLNRDITDGIETSPVITPVIDDSQVKSGVSAMNSLLGSTAIGRTVVLAGQVASGFKDVVNGITGSSSTVNNTYNYTQNNTSPKALSRAEIYRDGKNLFSNVKNSYQ